MPAEISRAELRFYGPAPFCTALIHGGPGAGGELAPVARALNADYAPGLGLLEPIQTADSVSGQVTELLGVLAGHATLPVTLVGYSWGAWLSWLAAAQNGSSVGKLILVSSGPFEERYVARLAATRLERLPSAEAAEFQALPERIAQASVTDQDLLLARLGALASKTDSFDPLPAQNLPGDQAGPRGGIFAAVWQQAADLRRSGALLKLASQIRCPVTVIHGDYDPHPAAGVVEPLANKIPDLKVILLKDCGHTPWLERRAREQFFAALTAELT